MRRSWLIIGLVVAGGLYYWTGDGEQPETVSKPGPNETGNTIGGYQQIPSQTFQNRDNRWDNGVTQPHQDKGGYNAVAPPPELGSYVPPYQEHSFRPLSDREKSLTRHKPIAAPTFPAPPEWQGNHQTPSDHRYQAYEAQRYDASPGRPQAAPVPGYKFRPIDSRRQPERWIGNYPRIPSTGPTSPMRSYPPEPKPYYAFY